MRFQQFIAEQLSLAPFDMNYYQQIAGNYADTQIMNRQDAKMYSVVDGQGNNLGAVGLFIHDGKPFTDVAIDPAQRGKGLLSQFYELLARKTRQPRLWAYVDKNNIPSVKSHEKMGFIKVGDEYGKFIYYKDFLQS